MNTLYKFFKACGEPIKVLAMLAAIVGAYLLAEWAGV
tara:strand:- start:182 stop:292 length:111 start_codon:yes stop_codon:yes gene_type:complete